MERMPACADEHGSRALSEQAGHKLVNLVRTGEFTFAELHEKRVMLAIAPTSKLTMGLALMALTYALPDLPNAIATLVRYAEEARASGLPMATFGLLFPEHVEAVLREGFRSESVVPVSTWLRKRIPEGTVRVVSIVDETISVAYVGGIIERIAVSGS